ncbi:MAG: MFS transporter [Gammaproteobacteria bacterium]|nr:MFS transporter [Gammaproteobacteria bacterium]
MPERPRAWRAIWLATRSRRTAAVSLLSFASGLPLGLVWIAIPTWLARKGVDIRVIGLFTLAQAPWSFKFLWSPLIDRYAVPIPRLSRKLGWTLLWQIVLLLTTLLLGGVAASGDAIWVAGALTLAIAFASASQDIAIDAYAVEILRPQEQGIAVGARIAVYRAAMFVAGGLTITLAGLWSWPVMFAVIAALYLPMMAITWFSPTDGTDRIHAPQSLRAAVWEPLVGFLAKQRALELLAFLVLYTLAENLAGALVRPFLVQVGFNDFDVGVATATIGLVATLTGTFLGGALTTAIGLGNALWAFGVLQLLSNLGYVLVAMTGVNRWVMYGSIGFESLAIGMATGAFSVLLLRMTQKEFSATQYALFSSIFALPRIFAGPVTGVMVAALGWRDFFLSTMVIGIPGLVMLQRFSPLGTREPHIDALATEPAPPLTTRALITRGLGAGLAAFAVAILSFAALGALGTMRRTPANGFRLSASLTALLHPRQIGNWIELFATVVFAVISGLVVAAISVARTHAAGGGDSTAGQTPD